MPNCLKTKWAASSLWKKKRGKCVKKCQTVIMALHIVAPMFSKPHFIHHSKPTQILHTKITYSKLPTHNWPHSIQIPKMKEPGNAEPS